MCSLLLNAVAGSFFITSELFPGNYIGLSRREEIAWKEERKTRRRRRRQSCLGLISGDGSEELYSPSRLLTFTVVQRPRAV